MKQKTVAEIVCVYCRIDGNCVNDVREENENMRAVVRKTTVRMTACCLGGIKKIKFIMEGAVYNQAKDSCLIPKTISPSDRLLYPIRTILFE